MSWLSPGSGKLSLSALATTAALSASACTGLAAGPESSASTPVPVSRDTAWARARRALTSEAFTLDLVDSTAGRLVGTRYASATAKQGSQAACRIRLTMGIRGDSQQSELQTNSEWIASESMQDQAPQVCEQERSQVLDRINTTVMPPPAQ